MRSSSTARGRSASTALRVILGGAAGLALATCGVAVGVVRAVIAPAGALPQAVFGDTAGAIIARYAFGLTAAGAALGALWPLAARSRRAAAVVGAVLGALCGVVVFPAMNAARPNWPVGSAPARGPYAWVADLTGGVVVGALLGWGFPSRGGRRERGSAEPRTDPPVV